MASGQPLDDEDRKPWLNCIREAAQNFEANNEHGVIVCSALKKKYRDRIKEGVNNITFLFLNGSMELIAGRMRQREGHFMKESMIKSQFDILERPDNEPHTIVIDIEKELQHVVETASSMLNETVEVTL